MTSEVDIGTMRETVARHFPELAALEVSVRTQGWDSLALDVGGRFIFKFPRSPNAEQALRREARLLAVVRNHVSMPVPDLTLYDGPPVFSRHSKIHGDHLLTEHYDRLTDAERATLADQLARFYAQMHAIPEGDVAAVGARPIKAWLSPDDVLRKVRPVLPDGLRAFAERAIADWAGLPPDPHGTTYGFFDGHGWNMAFDQERGRLNGIYDFADSGFGSLQQEFVYSNLIARDLTARIIDAYERMTGRAIDRQRVAILTGAHRLSELAEFAHDAELRPMLLQFLARWVDSGRIASD